LKLNSLSRKKRTWWSFSELCSGCGPCVDICPEAFELNEEGIAVVKVDEVPPEIEEACREAVDNCPTEAISIEELLNFAVTVVIFLELCLVKNNCTS
jgi:ferredoxin